LDKWRAISRPPSPVCLFPAAHAETLFVLRETGEEIALLDVRDGTEWCVSWHHSVEGFEVSDCHGNLCGHMVPVWSHLPDFAAGLDHISGRGRR